MPAYYLDSSAIVKRYVKETGTRWIRGLLDVPATNDVWTSRIAGAEVVAALTRRQRAGTIGQSYASAAIRQFRRALQRRFVVVEITPQVGDAGMDLAERHGLRGYDALHLAAALQVEFFQQSSQLAAVVFVCADARLSAAAAAEGLTVEDPNNH